MRHNGHFVLGLFIIVIGLVALLDALGVNLPTKYVWPVLLILAGLWLAVRALNREREPKEK
jgi:uncharacterized membrane protein HdeD (DUF308 family)